MHPPKDLTQLISHDRLTRVIYARSTSDDGSIRCRVPPHNSGYVQPLDVFGAESGEFFLCL
jgi:hypothetical protein